MNALKRAVWTFYAQHNLVVGRKSERSHPLQGCAESLIVAVGANRDHFHVGAATGDKSYVVQNRTLFALSISQQIGATGDQVTISSGIFKAAESRFDHAMPRPIHIPLSGRDRRHFMRQLKSAPQFEAAKLRQAAVLRADGETKLRAGAAARVRGLECTAVLWRIGTALADDRRRHRRRLWPSRGRLPSVQPDRHDRSRVLRRRPETELWKLEASLVCEHCRTETGKRTQAYIVGVAETRSPDPAPAAPGAAAQKP